MKIFIALILLLSFCYPAFSQKKEVADTTKKKEQNTTTKKDQDAQVVHITPGASGVKRSIGYKFSLKRGFEDPGNGIFRYNNDNVSDVTILYVDNIDISGEDQTKWYSTWDDTTGATARGRITIADVEGKVVTVFYFTDVFKDSDGFWILPVEYISGVLPIDNSVYYYVFDRIAKKEEQGNANQPAPVIPTNPVVPVAPVVLVTPVTEAVVNPVVPVVAVTTDTVVVPVVPVTEVTPVTPVVTVTPVVPVTPVTEVVVNPVVPVTAISTDTIVVPVIPVTEVVPVTPVVPVILVTEAVPVNPIVPANPVTPIVPVTPVTEVVQAKPVVPILPVKPDTIVIQANTAIPARRRIKTDTDRPDTLINPAVQVNTLERTRPLRPVSRDTVPNTVEKDVPALPSKPSNPVSQTKPVTIEKPVNQELPVIPAKPVSQPKPANPVSQPKPVVAEKPVTQEKPASPVSQPKPSNPVSQTYPANQGSQNYPVPESSRLPSYQRYTGSSSGIHGKWYRGIIEVGYGLGVGEYGIDNFRFNFINGFKIGSSSLGLGIGYRRYFTENNIDPYLVSKKSEVPVFIDFRTHFSDRNVTPYFAIGVGGTASADTTLSGKDRLFFTTSGGIWFNMSDRFAVFAGIAYELQKLEFSDTNPYTGNYRKNSNSISLNIGIAF